MNRKKHLIAFCRQKQVELYCNLVAHARKPVLYMGNSDESTFSQADMSVGTWSPRCSNTKRAY
jgi:hypothetical protein